MNETNQSQRWTKRVLVKLLEHWIPPCLKAMFSYFSPHKFSLLKSSWVWISAICISKKSNHALSILICYYWILISLGFQGEIFCLETESNANLHSLSLLRETKGERNRKRAKENALSLTEFAKGLMIFASYSQN